MYRLLFCLFLFISFTAKAKDHLGIASHELIAGNFSLIENGHPTPIVVADNELKGIRIAVDNLSADFQRVCGTKATVSSSSSSRRQIIVGSLQSPLICQIVAKGLISENDLKGKTEKYILKTVSNPLPGVDEAMVVVGSDMRGTIYGIYEISEQIGVSPWYYWADVPVAKEQNVSLKRGEYTNGEPAVRYRGIFLNDEAPCLTTWVKNTFGTNFGGHEFYAKVFELLLRLRANYLWPAMWSWSFYADDPLNTTTAKDMGIIMGTSHHEPMARNHQEWARNRKTYGAWDYSTNQKVIDKFFREGILRAKDTEDLITIGMRGDGDTAMGGKEGHDDELSSDDKAIMKLLQKIIANQRKIIKDVTGQPAEKRPQVWALYKEVQRYYDLGMKVPDDAIILLSDDNWGDVRRLPSAEELKNHSGGFGMYYHVDYVGAPRNTKWLNVTPIQHMWEQLQLTYDYGVDKLWVLNVGDLKPMEYPIDLFLKMAWRPTDYTVNTVLDHTRQFCAEAFGENNANEAARLLNLYSKYAGRVTPEMLDAQTYNLETGEWDAVCGQWAHLEADALRLYQKLPEESRDAFQQVILFPVQAFGNLYEMYCAQAKNQQCYRANLAEANYWADRVEECFGRDAELCNYYNKEMAGGKWDGMMIQKHIGYTSWNDNFPADKMPEVKRIELLSDNSTPFDEHSFYTGDGVVVMEAPHIFYGKSTDNAKWTVIPHMGRTLGGISLMPYSAPTDGAYLDYRFMLPEGLDSVTIHVVTNATLAFKRSEGHRYLLSIDRSVPTEINFNADLKDDPVHAYTVYYPTVSRRVVEKVATLPVKTRVPDFHTLTITPLDPGIVFEKIIIDFGGYKQSYLYMNESPCRRMR